MSQKSDQSVSRVGQNLANPRCFIAHIICLLVTRNADHKNKESPTSSCLPLNNEKSATLSSTIYHIKGTEKRTRQRGQDTLNNNLSQSFNKMVQNRQNASGTINKCSCGRVILQIQTTKSAEAKSLTRPNKPVKTHPPRGLKAFTSRSKKIAETKQDEGLAQTSMCLGCSQKSKIAMDRKSDRTNRVKVACSLSKLTNKKKENNSAEAKKDPPPREISLYVNESDVASSTPLTDAAQFREITNEQALIYYSPPQATKKTPCRFTFEGLGMSRSSTLDDSIFGMSMDEHRDDDRVGNLNDTKLIEQSHHHVVKPNGSAPSLEGTVQSEVTGENSLVSWEGGKSHKRTTDQVRSMGSEASMEFSEADFLRVRNTQEKNKVEIKTSDIAELTATAAALQVATPKAKNNGEEPQANVQTYFDCESGESLFWVFDFNPPKAGEEESLQNMLQGELTSKEVWFDLNSLFGMS